MTFATCGIIPCEECWDMGCKTEYDLDNWPPEYDDLPDLYYADAICADCMGRPSFVPAMCEECSLRLESMADCFNEP